jgi:hypothetical protein
MKFFEFVSAALAVALVTSISFACPPTPGPAPSPAPAVTLAVPAAQAFASASAAGAAPSAACLTQPIPLPGVVQTYSVYSQPVAASSLAVVPAQAVAVGTSGRCRTALLTDLRLARQAGRTARKAVLRSRSSTSTAVSQAIAIERN